MDLTKLEEELLELLKTMSPKVIAIKRKTTRNAVDQTLWNIRRKDAEARNYVNRLMNYRKHPRLRRYLLPVVRPPPEPLPEIE